MMKANSRHDTSPDPARPWGHEYQDMLGRERERGSLGRDTFCSGTGREVRCHFPITRARALYIKVEHKTSHASKKSADLALRPLCLQYCSEPHRHLPNPAHHRSSLLRSCSVILGATRWARRRERRKGNSANEFWRERHFKHSERRE